MKKLIILQMIIFSVVYALKAPACPTASPAPTAVPSVAETPLLSKQL